MSYYDKYLKYKSKYLQLGKGNSWINQRDELHTNLRKNVFILLWNKNPSDNADLISWLVTHKNIKDAKILVKNETEFQKIIDSLDTKDLFFLDGAERLNIVKRNTIPNINKEQINQYIINEKLKVSYSISNQENIIIRHNDTAVYSMYSIGKVFTGVLIMLLISDGTIDEKLLNESIQLHKNVLDQLSPEVKAGLRETTFLDCMTHNAGLDDYLPRYFADMEKAVRYNTTMPNPIEPEDFVVYADENLTKHKHTYSNLGLLLVGLSAKYHYNKKHKSTLSYNEILDEYIVNKIGLKTFSIVRSSNALHNEDITKYMNGSPAGGYFISCEELRVFGEWVNKNKSIHWLIEKYGTEFYHDGVILHDGAISPNLDKNNLTATTQLAIHLDSNIVISIMSNHYDDAFTLYNAMMLYKS